MRKDVNRKVRMLQKGLKGIIGLFGGIVTSATFGMGLYFIINFSLISVGSMVIGMSLLEVLITLMAVKSVQVYSVDEIKKEDSNLTLIKVEADNDKQDGKVEFTKIEPLVHLEIVNSNNRSYNHVRMIDKK